MKKLLVVLVIAVNSSVCFGQVGGNIGYSQAANGRAKAEQQERSKRSLPQGEMPPSATTMFLDAAVLMNVKADEYVAAFGVSQEGTTVPECHQKMDAAINVFSGELRQLGIAGGDIFVDFAAQNKIYGYQVADGVAKESLVGFELKKNVTIHYKDKMLLDKQVVAASRSQIFDLIKVDYVVRDIGPIQNRLMEEAAKVIKQKALRNEKLLGIKLLPQAQVYAEKPSIYYPTEMYDSYTAAESEDVSRNYYQSKFSILGAHKSRTFFFNALDANGFDKVVNSVVIEPVVQFTLYLKVKYGIEQTKSKSGKPKS